MFISLWLISSLFSLCKNMSNEAFAKLKPVYLEHKTLKDNLTQKDQTIAQLQEKTKGIPNNIYEHPNGFVLTPEYSKLSQTVGMAQQIQNHWADQLKKIREGAATYTFIGKNPNTGEFYQEERPADKNAEVDLLTYFNHAQMQTAKTQAKLESLYENHTTKYKEAVGWLQNFEHQSFSLFDKPESKAQWDKVITSTISNFPSTFQQSPLAPLLAKALITVNNLGRLLLQQNNGGQQPIQQQTQTTTNGKKVNPKDVKRAGPSSRDVGATTAQVTNGTDSDISLDDFQRVKDGY